MVTTGCTVLTAHFLICCLCMRNKSKNPCGAYNVCVFNFGYMYVCNSVHVHCMQSITDEGNRGLVKRLEKSVSLWASVSEQPKYACT